MGKEKSITVFAMCSRERLTKGLSKLDAKFHGATIRLCPPDFWKVRPEGIRAAAPSCRILLAKRHITVNDKRDTDACTFAAAIWKSDLTILFGECERSTSAIHGVATRMSRIRKIQLVT